MTNLPKLSVLGLMLLLHFIADFVFQSVRDANLKQKKWWEEATKDMANKEIYRYDWIAGMACHCLLWSLMVCLPFVARPIYLPMAIAQAIIHFWIDDRKANRFKINLIEDQLLHLVQIVGTWLSAFYPGVLCDIGS